MFGPTLAIVSHWCESRSAFISRRCPVEPDSYDLFTPASPQEALSRLRRRRMWIFHRRNHLSDHDPQAHPHDRVRPHSLPLLVPSIAPLSNVSLTPFSPSFQWTLRACALIIGVFVSFGWFVLRPRLAPVKSKGGLFNFAAFKNPTFSLYVAGCWLVMNGLYTPITYLDVAGTRAGLGEFSSYLVAITNAFSIVGRLGPGYFADKVSCSSCAFRYVGARSCADLVASTLIRRLARSTSSSPSASSLASS